MAMVSWQYKELIILCLLYACIAHFLSTTSNIILFASRGYEFCFTSCSGLDIGSKTVLCKLLLNQQMSGMRVNLMSHKTSNSLPRNRMQKRDGNRTNEVWSNPVKFIRYNSTFFVHRMYPSYHLPRFLFFMLHGYAQRYPFNTERLLVFPEMISPTQLFSCPFVT